MTDLSIILLGVLTCVAFYAIVFHEYLIETIGKKLCKHGYHRFKKRKYYCNRCRIGREWPKLVKHEGGKDKKALIFPKI